MILEKQKIYKKGSSYNLPAHGSGGARARKNNAAKISVQPSEGAASTPRGAVNSKQVTFGAFV